MKSTLFNTVLDYIFDRIGLLLGRPGRSPGPKTSTPPVPRTWARRLSLGLFERKNGGWIRHSVERARRKVYESTSTLSRPDSRPLKGQLCGQGWSLSFIDDGQQVDRIFITWVGISGEQGLEPFLPNSSGFLAFFVLFMSGLIRLLVALF